MSDVVLLGRKSDIMRDGNQIGRGTRTGLFLKVRAKTAAAAAIALLYCLAAVLSLFWTPYDPTAFDPPAHGQHSAEVLRSLGYSQRDVLGMREKGVIKGPA